MARLSKSAMAMLEGNGIEMFESSGGDYWSFFLREWNGHERFYKTSDGAVRAMLRLSEPTAMYGVRRGDGSTVLIAAY